MKLATWNINSIRARNDRLLAWLASRGPDVVCMQEVKCTDAEFPAEELRALGYHSVVHGQKTYNGVALLSREPLEDVTRGFSDGGDDSQSRCIAATTQGLRVISVYVPNGKALDSDKYPYKLEWLARLARWLPAQLAAHTQLAVCGDYNVAPEPIDVHDPAAWEGQVLFSPPERAALAAIVALGVQDVWRARNPGTQAFSWWDYRQLGFPKNRGLRIDHILATPALAARVTSASIDREERKGKLPSDHAPVIAELA